ncbi:helicase-related protein [Yimella sp. NH-Cas1]|uniref:helicase-related protein n=1 Tax=Yimella sp. NH-Cas1 TaxID=2917726 RepID=UPI001EFA886D|nr:helicase-related protein [Yimella sp. NH-Cas1]MCG8654839.1 phospholipase D-like domain-containing protein [Yimella sp. NH-Cas1]
MTRIFDNIEDDDRLGPHLIKTFESSDRLDAAVGYFNLRGWSTFADSIDAKPTSDAPVMRVLVGMAVGGQDEDELLQTLQAELEGTDIADVIDGEIARARKTLAVMKFRTQLMRGLPTSRDQATLRRLRGHLAEERVAIKLFTRRPLHGKTYLAFKEDPNHPITGFVGSSNLTMAGLEHNYELNVDVLDFNAAAKLAQWFEDRWDDRFSIDITEDLIALIDESWAAETPPTPYEVYLKVCYHLSRDVREGQLEYSLPPDMRNQLLDYQVNAVQTLSRRVYQRGGTMLGDVVGLGKTLTAVATALVLREQYGYSTLVLCPKNLTRMWKEHLDAYDVPGEVVSYSTAHRDLPDLRRYQLVILDESHNLRSDKRRDYKAIKEYIERNESKVLLLTATPYNVRFTDVANQLSMYIGEDDDLGLEPREALRGNPRIRDLVDGRTNTMQAFRRSEEAEDWKNLMSEHLVRRTRSFVKANYGKTDPVNGREYLAFPDGGRFYFPIRLPMPIDHDFGPKDPAALISSDDALDAINALKLPRYALIDYVDKKVKLTPAEEELVKDWERARSRLIGITRTHFYKRLSSCGYAYDISLKRHLARNEMWIHAFDNGIDVPTGTVIDEMFSDGEPDPDASDENYDALKGRKPESVTWVRHDLFTDDMVQHLRNDSDIIRRLIALYSAWEAKNDSKLAALIDLLTKTHKDDKVLIFTEYKDTAEYVERSLREAGVSSVALVSGNTDNPTNIVRRFSPVSNAKPHEDPKPISKNDEVRVLVATDVLSEGQNLQDSHIVVNYDLPWAIIRLIQRAGRVDRVGQQAEEILLYTFFHKDVENVINLRQRIAGRLANNAQAFGSDEKFFGSPEETQELHNLYDGKLVEGESESEVDASSLAYEVWANAEEETPDLTRKVQSMPDLVYSTRPALPRGDADGVACYVRTENGYDGFGLAEPGEELRLLTGHQALNVFSAESSTPTLPIRADHFNLTADLVRGPLAQASTIEGRLRGVRLQVWNRLSQKLDTPPEVTEALEALYARPLQTMAERRLRSALKTRPSDEDLGDLLALLHRDENLVVPDAAGADPIRIVCTMGVSKA